MYIIKINIKLIKLECKIIFKRLKNTDFLFHKERNKNEL